MGYQNVKTKYGNEALYVPSEKMLYTYKGRKQEYVCNQTVLKSQKNKNHVKHPGCTVRIRRLANGLCERMNANNPHSFHPDHEMIVTDK